MQNLGYYNGTIAPIEEILVPMNDRVCFFGDGVYDATITGNHRIYALKEHIDRFFASAASVEIKIPLGREELGALLADLVKRVDAPCQFVYWQVTRGTADRKHGFPNVPANLWITLRPFVLPDITQKINLITMEDTRHFHCDIKSLNLLPNVIGKQKAEEAGCYEVVFHRSGRVTECASNSLQILKGGMLIAPPLDSLVLPGIARAHLVEACKTLGVPVAERPFTLKEMMAADEVLVSNQGNFCLSARRIDGEAVGGKAPELLERLQQFVLARYRRATTPPAGE